MDKPIKVESMRKNQVKIIGVRPLVKKLYSTLANDFMILIVQYMYVKKVHTKIETWQPSVGLQLQTHESVYHQRRVHDSS